MLSQMSCTVSLALLDQVLADDLEMLLVLLL